MNNLSFDDDMVFLSHTRGEMQKIATELEENNSEKKNEISTQP